MWCPQKIRPRCLDVLAEGKLQHLSRLGDDGGMILEFTAHLLEHKHGLGSPLTYGAPEPVLEACRADARVIAENEALIVRHDLFFDESASADDNDFHV